MVTVVLTLVPKGLRGYLSRWLWEVSAGVFVGSPSARVRDLLWDRVLEHVAEDSAAVMIISAPNEQGFDVRCSNPRWRILDHDSLPLFAHRQPEAAGEVKLADNFTEVDF